MTAEPLAALLREAADEIEDAHVALDRLLIPRRLPGANVVCTLARRITLLADRAVIVA